ncbi:hypothetical protein A7X93_00530 [Stenotrophomonas maltophilia]|nr:hypothetical protein A7X93_00530 [Stenotrophomonas maltophilia]
MADPRELLARLSAQTVRFDTGLGGGGGGLANIDIAHALGCVPSGLGREVVECCFLDTEVRPSAKLRMQVLGAVLSEWRRQEEQLSVAKVELSFHQAMAVFSRTVSPDLRRLIDRAQADFDSARAQCWPRDAATMVAPITLAALQEIAGSSACDACHGYPMVPCTRCGGAGYISWSDRTRANAICRSQSAYRDAWSGMYNWILALLRDAEQDAIKHMARALSAREVA